MNILHLDCGMGAAGDMLSAALLELFSDPDGMVGELNAIGIPHVRFSREKIAKCGIMGTAVRVLVDGQEEEAHGHGHGHHSHDHGHGHEAHAHAHEHDTHEHTHHAHGDHHHASLADMEQVIDTLSLPDQVREHVRQVFQLLAAAESYAHGMPIEQIHFHEVGTMDALADITAVCFLLDRLAPDKITASPVHVGAGHVHCAHGILPVPAPATALILQGVPTYGGAVQGELCTPTGAALLKHFVMHFGDMPLMQGTAIGYGLGKRDYEQLNCVRAMLGVCEGGSERIAALSCNLDDMTAEHLAFAQQCLLDAGARDVYTTPIGMKKGRQGVMLTVLCMEEDRDHMVQLLFRHTTTCGVREERMTRHVLARQTETVQTPLGPVSRKVSRGFGVTRRKYEYDDVAAIARANDIPIASVLAHCDVAERKAQHK